MTDNPDHDKFPGRRSEPRSITDRYHCVEFQLKGIGNIFQFKIWDISTKGMCVLVKKDSSVMGHINVGDVIAMKYFPTRSSGTVEELQTKIRHITKSEEGRFNRHYLVGLSVRDSIAVSPA